MYTDTLPAPPTPRTLADLMPGQEGRIADIAGHDLGVKLMEMGCLPGCRVRLARVAPLGCPLCLELEGGGMLSIRRDTARFVHLDEASRA